MPRLSIIVTAYNIEAYIRECLDSVTGQTLRDIEIIVVDDGSTDATAAIIRDHAARDARIRPIIFAKNTIGGVATAANAGMDAATGDFIGFADGDDIYDPRMFEKLLEAAETHSADLAMCDYHVLDDSTGTLMEPADARQWKSWPQGGAVDLDEEGRRRMLLFVSVPWRKIYRRDLVERINLRFPVGDYFFEDNPFHWAAILGGRRMAMVPEKLCRHRVARAGQTMATVDSRLLRIFLHHDTIRDELRRQGFEAAHGRDLLRWTAGQLAWTSERATGPVLTELYTVLRPVIGQYDRDAIEEFGRLHGKGRTYLMLEALRTDDRAAFERAAKGEAGGAAKGGRARGSLFARGLFHLRHSGLRRTARIGMRYIGERLGTGAPGRPGTPAADRHVPTASDLMAAMIVLQADLRGLRAELAELRREHTPHNDHPGDS